MRTLLAFLLSFFVVGPCLAQSDEDVAESLWYEGVVGGSPSHASADEACRAKFTNSNLDKTRNHYDYALMRGNAPQRAGDCYIHTSNPDTGYIGQPFLWQGVSEACPTGFSPGSGAGHQHCHRPTTCASKAGQSKTVNFTTGWAQSNNPDSPKAIDVPMPGSGCDGQCAFTRGGVQSCWWSQVPHSNGLHRVSCDSTVTLTGAACQGGASPSNNPGTPEPPCPGVSGQVNGKPVCIGSTGTPLPSIPKPGNGTPPAAPGNPGSGDKPTTGPGAGNDGAGRTPTVGEGGNEGGGSSSVVPGGGSEGNGQGTGTPTPTNPDGSAKPADPTPCGIPGSPACRLDETGTPNGTGAFDGATAGVNSNRDSAVAGINAAAGASGKATGWSFTLALPTGCSPIPMGAYAPYLTGINICEWQPQIHDLMSMAWLAAAVFLCIGMVGRAIGGGSS